MKQCPKCRYDLQEKCTRCPSCGIVFEKYFKYHPAPTPQQDIQSPVVKLYDKTTVKAWRKILFHEERSSYSCFLGRSIIFIGLIIWSWLLISAGIDSNTAGESILHAANLPFHEAGHLIFRPFGVLVTSLGGSLGQLLMPGICMVVLLINTRDPFGASVALWWLGENFLDMAPYINDARAGQLLLLDGNYGHSAPYGFHDWEFILTESGLLYYDHVLAIIAYVLGSAIMILSLTWGGFLLIRQYRNLTSENDTAPR